ncbi:alpha/beta hydrolase [Roseomonas populi]|uniref:Alpha/beta hydrolase-fold protein n=1 Tax=Roseomonas populi TaxID=3121582 RepID=A0ABT1X2R9_9PROT|nr:alpha/beta hydrolase-fold protein [Roseomonas pecuniae]MCR0982410.1 alpha/beta hydrolase-fold protein [Roseomonas pecuniae]
MSPTVHRRALLAALPALSAARSATAQPGPPPEAVSGPGIETFDLGSGAGHEWRITLARPEGPPPAGGYPCLWLLDGNATFPMAWRARQQAGAGAGGVALVGIGHPGEGRPDNARRFLELTPPTVPETFGERRREDPPETGGRGAFLAFLDTVLRPELQRRLPLDPGRMTLFGHSLGGLFGLHVLFTRPEMFEAYALADPSIWWNRRSILDEQAAFLAGMRLAGGRAARPVRVLVSISGKPGRAESVARMGPPNGRDTAAALAAIPGLRVGFRDMPEENHGTMMAPSISNALKLALGRSPEEIAAG